MKGKLLVVIPLFLLFVFLVACGGQSAPATSAPQVNEKATQTQLAAKPAYAERKVLCWTPPDIQGVFKTATDWFDTTVAEANKNGFDILLVTRSPASHTAFGDQVAIVEDYITRKCDVIAISPIEVEVVKPALKKANDAGIPVIVVNLLEPIEGIKVASYIGFDNAQAAKVSASAILDYFGGPGVLGTGRKVDVQPEQYLDLPFWDGVRGTITADEKASIKARGAIIEGVAGGFFSVARLKGFHEVMDQFPGIQIVGSTCAADWNREKAIKCTENILGANPKGTLDFIWGASNEMGLGAMLTVERLGRTEVKVFTNDVTPESVDRIKEGKLVAETTHGFADWGHFGSQFAIQIMCGEEVPQIQDIHPRTAYQANADLFYPNPKLPAVDWTTIKANCKAPAK